LGRRGHSEGIEKVKMRKARKKLKKALEIPMRNIKILIEELIWINLQDSNKWIICIWFPVFVSILRLFWVISSANWAYQVHLKRYCPNSFFIQYWFWFLYSHVRIFQGQDLRTTLWRWSFPFACKYGIRKIPIKERNPLLQVPWSSTK